MLLLFASTNLIILAKNFCCLPTRTVQRRYWRNSPGTKYVGILTISFPKEQRGYRRRNDTQSTFRNQLSLTFLFYLESFRTFHCDRGDSIFYTSLPWGLQLQILGLKSVVKVISLLWQNFFAFLPMYSSLASSVVDFFFFYTPFFIILMQKLQHPIYTTGIPHF